MLETRRTAALALVCFVAADLVGTVMDVGHYEDDITIATHGEPDLFLPAAFYSLADAAVREARFASGWGLPDTIVLVHGIWVVALVVSLGAVGLWWRRERQPLGAKLRMLLGAAVALKVLALVHRSVAAPPRPVIDGFLTDRPFSYPLWTIASFVLMVAVFRLAHAIRFAAGPEPAAAAADSGVATDR